VRTRTVPQAAPSVVRCAIYSRQSVEERGRNGFGSLEAQREAGEKYVSLFEEKGWQALPDRYEDGGFSGGTLERPALKRLRADIAGGKIDCVVVYRGDRISRNIREFLDLMEEFDGHDVSFVSVSEQFDTSTPAGRMQRNMLLTFAEYERELIAERTRHKVHAARRRGRFTGGLLSLGYDRHPDGGRLVVNEAEAKRVRRIFRLFLRRGSIIETVQDLNRRGWSLKRWKTKEGRDYGGGAFDQHSLRRLLTNALYVGKVRFEGQLHAGAHEAIVDQSTWDRVQHVLTDGARGPRGRRTRSNALLAGLLRCASCDCAMTPTYSQKRGLRYRYYVCLQAHRRGHATCPSPTVKATDIEGFVIDRIRAIGQDEDLVARTVELATQQLDERKASLEASIRRRRKRLDRAHAEMRKGLEAVTGTQPATAGTGAEHQITRLEEHLTAAQDELAGLRAKKISADDLRVVLQQFDPLWANMTTVEQARIVHLLIERIDYDGKAGKVGITFSPAGVRTLARTGAQ